MVSPILEISSLSKNYGDIKALNEVSFRVEQGMVFGILGPNGSGKTTTLGILLGVLNASSGDFSWFGNGALDENRKRIGAMLETPNFYPYLDAVQNLKIVAQIKQLGQVDERIIDVLGKVDLLERKNSNFKSYSLGMKQRLALASTLLSDPDVLVLDEPTNGLDPQGIAEIRDLIQKIAKEGKTILIASHQLDEIEKVCSDVVILKKGVVIRQSSVENVVKGSSRQLIISAKNIPALEKLIAQINGVSLKTSKPNALLLDVHEDVSSEYLNEYCFNNGVILSELREIRKSLEDQFLEITKE